MIAGEIRNTLGQVFDTEASKRAWQKEPGGNARRLV